MAHPANDWKRWAICAADFLELTPSRQARICRECPVQLECLEWALDVEQQLTPADVARLGTVYGAHTAGERAQLLADRSPITREGAA